MMGVAMVAKDEEFVVMLVVQYVAYLRPSELCNLTTGQVIRPLQVSGASSWALLSALQEELKASKTGEFNESVLLDGHLSVALGKALTRYTAGKASATPPLEPISGKIRRGFCQKGRGRGSKRDHDSSSLGSSRRSVVRCALADPIADGKQGRWRSEKSVRRYEKHARLLKEPRSCSCGALPPPPPVLTRLVRNRA